MKYKKGLLIICLIICLFSIASVVASDVNETVVASEDQSEEVISVENQEENNLEHEILSANNVEDNNLTASIDDHKLSDVGYVDLTGDNPYLQRGVKEAMFKTPWKSKSVHFGIYELYENGYYMLSYSNTKNTNNEGLCLIKYDFYSNFYLKMWTNSTDEKTYHILRSDNAEIYVPPNSNQNSKDTKTTHKSGKIITGIKVNSIKVKPNSKIHIIGKVYDKSNGKKLLNGKVEFKIMGKTYKVNVKNGIAKIKIKIPSKLKTYTCRAIFLGDKNTKSSSKTFKIIVKKPVVKKKTTKITSAKKKKSNGKAFTLKLTKPEKNVGKTINGNHIYAFYKYRNTGQYGRGVCVDSYGKYGPGVLIGIKLIKAKIYFKNNYNGKTKIITKKFDKYGYTKANIINGYRPYKIIVFYK